MVKSHLSAEAANKQQRLAGKVAVVTGSGAGIGKGCALMFARQGATVVGFHCTPATIEATVAEARVGMKCTACACDMTDPDGVRSSSTLHWSVAEASTSWSMLPPRRSLSRL